MSNAVTRARKLRRTMTDPETAFWYLVRGRQLKGHKFRRQNPVGKYIADFACEECRLIVEIDGGQHCGSLDDVARTAYLEARGLDCSAFLEQRRSGQYQGRRRSRFTMSAAG